MKYSSSNKMPLFYNLFLGTVHPRNTFFTYLFFSLWMSVLFPCQNFMNLSTGQQNSLKYLFMKALIHLVPKLSTLNIANLHLQKASMLLIVLCDDLTYLWKGKLTSDMLQCAILLPRGCASFVQHRKSRDLWVCPIFGACAD